MAENDDLAAWMAQMEQLYAQMQVLQSQIAEKKQQIAVLDTLNNQAGLYIEVGINGSEVTSREINQEMAKHGIHLIKEKRVGELSELEGQLRALKPN